MNETIFFAFPSGALVYQMDETDEIDDINSTIYRFNGRPFVFSCCYSTIIKITSTLIFFLVTLEFLELSCRDNIKCNQEELWIFPPKTPTLYQ